MVSNLTICVVFNIISTILSYVSLGIGIASVANRYWVVYTLGNKGLFDSYETIPIPCMADPSTICFVSAQGEDWIRASRAFMILMIIFNFCGCLANLVSQCKKNKKARQGSGSTFGTAGTFGLIGAAVFTGVWNNRISTLVSFVYGFGFVGAWVSVDLLYLANLFNYLSYTYMCDDEEEHP